MVRGISPQVFLGKIIRFLPKANKTLMADVRRHTNDGKLVCILFSICSEFNKLLVILKLTIYFFFTKVCAASYLALCTLDRRKSPQNYNFKSLIMSIFEICMNRESYLHTEVTHIAFQCVTPLSSLATPLCYFGMGQSPKTNVFSIKEDNQKVTFTF